MLPAPGAVVTVAVTVTDEPSATVADGRIVTGTGLGDGEDNRTAFFGDRIGDTEGWCIV